MTPKQTPASPSSRVEAARASSGLPLVAVAAAALVVVLIGVAIAVAVVRGDDDGEVTTGEGAGEVGSEQSFGPVVVDGEALPRFPGNGADDPAVGMAAPALEGQTPAGEDVAVGPGDGPVVLAFVAHWCPHCGAEVPRLVDLADEAGEIDGVRLVAVATGTNAQAPNYPPGSWLDGEGWPGPVVLDDEQATAARAYGLTGYPFLVAVDGDGTVRARSSGEQGHDGLREFFALVAP